MKEELARDRLVIRICDHVLSEHLQMEVELTLDKAKRLIYQHEAVKEQQERALTHDSHAQQRMFCVIAATEKDIIAANVCPTQLPLNPEVCMNSPDNQNSQNQNQLTGIWILW